MTTLQIGPYRRWSGPDRVEQKERTPIEKFKDFLVRVGDNLGQSLERSVAGVVGTCSATTNLTSPEAMIKLLGEHKQAIFDMLLECALHLPTKTPVYGTIIGLLNLKFPEAGREVCFLLREIVTDTRLLVVCMTTLWWP